MDKQVAIQAQLLGINLAKWDILRRLGATPQDNLGYTKNLTLDHLIAAEANGVNVHEITTLGNVSEHTLGTYIALRNFVQPQVATKIIESREASDYLRGLQAGLAYKTLAKVVNRGVKLADYYDAQGTGITIDELAEIMRIQQTTWGYIGLRESGYTHQELIDVLGLPKSGRGNTLLGWSQYELLREAGTSHEQIMELGRELTAEELEVYVCTRISRDTNPYTVRDFTHKAVLRVITLSVKTWPLHVLDYLHALGNYQASELDNALAAGLSVKEYTSFRDSHCRVSHDETVQYAQIYALEHPHLKAISYKVRDTMFAGINDFLILVDAGVQFEDLLAAAKAGIGIVEYRRLFDADFEVSAQEIVEVGQSPVGWYKYRGLRNEGLSHGDIMAAARDMPVASSAVSA